LDKTGISNSNFSYKINNAKYINPNNNIIRISNLPYGKHKLTIFLYDNFGNLKDQKVIIINAKVPFYYQINFYIFLALLILISGIGIIYYIIKSRKIETKIKDQIAMDLHDEVGTVLTRMLFISKSNKKLELQHDEIKKGIIEALFSIRTSITALSNTNTTLENLIYDTKELLHKELSNTSIEFLINEKKEFSSINLKPELYRDCKLIIFEATTNMIKYSNATSFFIHFDLDCQFTITITDNGHLKNINSIYNKGNGIANIIKRTERNKGTYSFSIVPPHGLSIQLKFNIK
jgi:signal transduction histidine kinase